VFRLSRPGPGSTGARYRGWAGRPHRAFPCSNAARASHSSVAKCTWKWGGDDFFVDLLFYHLKLRCYVVVELKATAFKPEYAGQLNFYLSAVDGLLKHEHDQPTIGLLLCKSQNRVVAEYALKDIAKPIGVAEYQLIEALPKELETSLPSIERIEAELSQAEGLQP